MRSPTPTRRSAQRHLDAARFGLREHDKLSPTFSTLPDSTFCPPKNSAT
jgi:hypothetical protein